MVARLQGVFFLFASVKCTKTTNPVHCAFRRAVTSVLFFSGPILMTKEVIHCADLGVFSGGFHLLADNLINRGKEKRDKEQQ